jgi:hypothetical protein
MATKIQIQDLADKYNIRVEFAFGVRDGEFGGETHLRMPDGKTVEGGASGYTIFADDSRSRHLTAVMDDLRRMIDQIEAP